MSRDGDYWDGGTWVYHATITNDVSDAATHSYTVTPGAGNEMEILYLRVLNGDTASRTIIVQIDDGANVLYRMAFTSIGAGTSYEIPNALTSTAVGSGTTRLILSGTMRLLCTVSSVAVSEDSALGLVCRIRGGAPTVVEAATAGVPVIAVNTERTF